MQKQWYCCRLLYGSLQNIKRFCVSVIWKKKEEKKKRYIPHMKTAKQDWPQERGNRPSKSRLVGHCKTVWIPDGVWLLQNLCHRPNSLYRLSGQSGQAGRKIWRKSTKKGRKRTQTPAELSKGKCRQTNEAVFKKHGQRGKIISSLSLFPFSS